jgi:hypothetical protein
MSTNSARYHHVQTVSGFCLAPIQCVTELQTNICAEVYNLWSVTFMSLIDLCEVVHRHLWITEI